MKMAKMPGIAFGILGLGAQALAIAPATGNGADDQVLMAAKHVQISG